MSDEVFKKIIDEILPHRPKKIKPYLTNEPLLDKRLPDFIKYINDNRHPSTITEVYSNGSLLSEEMGEKLIDSGLDRLIVSFQGIDPELYEKTMVGLKYEKVLNNLLNFIKIKKRRAAKKPYFEIRMVNTGFSNSSIKEHRKFWSDKGVRLVVKPLENRVNDEIEKAGYQVHKWKLRSFCRRLFSYAWIMSNGDMVLCCCDVEGNQVLGNIKDKTIAEVWTGDRYAEVRQKFISGKVDDIICGKCKVDAI